MELKLTETSIVSNHERTLSDLTYMELKHTLIARAVELFEALSDLTYMELKRWRTTHRTPSPSAFRSYLYGIKT